MVDVKPYTRDRLKRVILAQTGVKIIDAMQSQCCIWSRTALTAPKRRFRLTPNQRNIDRPSRHVSFVPQELTGLREPLTEVASLPI